MECQKDRKKGGKTNVRFKGTNIHIQTFYCVSEYLLKQQYLKLSMANILILYSSISQNWPIIIRMIGNIRKDRGGSDDVDMVRIKQCLTILSDPGMNCTEVQKFFESLSEDLHTLNLLFTVVSYSNLNGQLIKGTCLLLNRLLVECHRKINFSFMINWMTKILFNWTIPNKVKMLFQSSLTAIIENYSIELDGLFYKIYDYCLAVVGELQRGLQEQNHLNIDTSLCYGQNETVNLILNQCCDLNNLDLTLVQLCNIFETINGAKQDKIQYLMMLQRIKKLHRRIFFRPLNQNNQNIIEEMLLIWQNFNRKISDMQTTLKYQMLDLVASFEDWEYTFQNIYRYQSYKQNNQIWNYICVANTDEGSQKIYELKSLASQIQLEMTNLAMTALQKEGILLKILNNLILQFINSLKYYTENQSLGYGAQNFASNLLSLYNIALQVNREAYIETFPQIVQFIILPLLSLDDYDMQIFDRPSQFHNEIQDCIYYHAIQFPRTQAAKILETICQISPNYFSYLIQFVRYCLQKNLKIQYEVWQFPQAFLNKKVISTDTCFLILSILAYLTLEYNEVFEMVSKLVGLNFQQKLNARELCLYFTLLSYCFKEMFNNYSDASPHIKIAVSNKLHPTCRQFALDFIGNVCEVYFDWQYFRLFFSAMMEDPIQKCWQVLHKIIDTHLTKFNQEDLCIVVRQLRMHSMRIFELFNDSKISNCQEAHRALYQIRYLSNCNSYLKNMMELRKQFLAVLMLFEPLQKLYIDDLLIWVGSNLLKMRSEMESFFQQFLTIFIKKFSDNGYDGMCYFQFMNLFIQKSNVKQKQINEIMSVLIEAISVQIYYPYEQNEKAHEIQLSNYLIMIQNVLLCCGNMIKPEFIEDSKKIYQDLRKTMESLPQKKRYSCFLLKIRLLNFGLLVHKYTPIYGVYEQVIQDYTQNHNYTTYDAFILAYIFNDAVERVDSLQLRYQLIRVIVSIIEQQGNYFLDGKNFMQIVMRRYDLHLDSFNSILHFAMAPLRIIDDVKQECYRILDNFKNSYSAQFYRAVESLQKNSKNFLEKTKRQREQILKNRVIKKIKGVKQQVDLPSFSENFVFKRNIEELTEGKIDEDKKSKRVKLEEKRQRKNQLRKK